MYKGKFSKPLDINENKLKLIVYKLWSNYIYKSGLTLHIILMLCMFKNNLQAELYTLIKKHHPPPVYTADRLAEMYGAQWNQIDLLRLRDMWHNTSFNIKDDENLYSEAIKKVSSSFTEQKKNVNRQQLQVGPRFKGVYS